MDNPTPPDARSYSDEEIDALLADWQQLVDMNPVRYTGCFDDRFVAIIRQLRAERDAARAALQKTQFALWLENDEHQDFWTNEPTGGRGLLPHEE